MYLKCHISEHANLPSKFRSTKDAFVVTSHLMTFHRHIALEKLEFSHSGYKCFIYLAFVWKTAKYTYGFNSPVFPGRSAKESNLKPWRATVRQRLEILAILDRSNV